jgi:hypothetical protein
MELQEKLALINENLVEVLNPELIEQPLTEGRNPRIYWVSSYSPKWPPIPSYLIWNVLTIFFLRGLQRPAGHTAHICEWLSIVFLAGD